MRRSPVPPALLCLGAVLLLLLSGAWSGAEAAQAAGGTIQVPRGALDTPFLERLRSVVGLLALTGIAWLVSTNRSKVAWRGSHTGAVGPGGR